MKLKIILPFLLSVISLNATDIQVTNIDDTGVGSLRQAILDANADTAAAPPYVIKFGELGAGIHTITLATPLDPITADGTIIDGTSAIDWQANNPVIVINANVQSTGLGIANARDCVIQGVVVNNAVSAHIEIISNDTSLTTQNNAIYGCFIGTDQTGTASVRPTNSYPVGISIFGNAADQQVMDTIIGGSTEAQRNLISGMTDSSGIRVQGYIDGIVIKGNYIGTDKTGTGLLKNWFGIRFDDPTLTRGVIGGSATGEGNVISGSRGGMGGPGYGIVISNTDTVIEGNFIGTNAAGTAAIANDYGIFVDGGSCVIGGDTIAKGNKIAYNFVDGILLEGVGSNIITNNVISAHGAYGINIIAGSDSNIIENNYIGTDAAGTVLANNDAGIFISSQGNKISDNIITNTSVGPGVMIIGAGATLNAMVRNAMYNNNDSGIELYSGANNDQTAPTLVSATSIVGTDNLVTIQATAPALPINSDFKLEFFINDTDRNADSITEGQTFIGAVESVPTGVTVTEPFTVALPSVVGKYVSATATNLNDLTDPLSPNGDTSKYSENIILEEGAEDNSDKSPIIQALLVKYY